MNEPKRAMNDSTASRNRKRWLFVLLVMLVSIIVCIGVYYRNQKLVAPLSEAERELVGTWRCHWDDPKFEMNSRFGYEFRPDRTCIKRWYDPKTGKVTSENIEYTWLRNGDRLMARNPRGGGSDIWGFRISRYSTSEVYVLIPDGSNQFKFQSSGYGETESGPQIVATKTGTLTRVIEKE